jgi:hypothetical protein
VRFAFAESVDNKEVRGYLRQVRSDALRDARIALLGVEEMIQGLDDLKKTDSAMYSGAMIHMIIDQMQTRIQWAEQMSEQFTQARTGESSATLVENLYVGAAQRLRGLLGEDNH